MSRSRHALGMCRTWKLPCLSYPSSVLGRGEGRGHPTMLERAQERLARRTERRQPANSTKRCRGTQPAHWQKCGKRNRSKANCDQNDKSKPFEYHLSHRGHQAQKQCFGNGRCRHTNESYRLLGKAKAQALSASPKYASPIKSSRRQDHNTNKYWHGSTNKDGQACGDSKEVHEKLTEGIAA